MRLINSAELMRGIKLLLFNYMTHFVYLSYSSNDIHTSDLRETRARPVLKFSLEETGATLLQSGYMCLTSIIRAPFLERFMVSLWRISGGVLGFLGGLANCASSPDSGPVGMASFFTQSVLGLSAGYRSTANRNRCLD